MRKQIIIATLISSLLLVGCSKTDNKENTSILKSNTSLVKNVKIEDKEFKKYNDLVNESKTITYNEFYQIQEMLPDNITYFDGTGTESKGVIKPNNGFYSTGNYIITSKLVDIANEKLDDFSELNTENLNTSSVIGLDNLYSILEYPNRLYNYFGKIKVIGKVDKDATITATKIITRNYEEKGYIVNIHNNKKITQTGIFGNNDMSIYLLFNQNGTLETYYKPAFKDYFYFGSDEDGEKLYVELDFDKTTLRIGTLNDENIKINGKEEIQNNAVFTPTTKKASIFYKGGVNIYGKEEGYGVLSFITALNTEFTKLFIGDKEITNGELFNKNKLINFYK